MKSILKDTLFPFGDQDPDANQFTMTEKIQRDLKKPFKVPPVSIYPAKSTQPSSDALMSEFNFHRCRFRVLHDPSPYPISGERCMSKFEVQYGLRYNTFTKGTIIEDIVAGSLHEVVTRNIFKATHRGGMLAFIESELVPPHPMVTPPSDSEEST